MRRRRVAAVLALLSVRVGAAAGALPPLPPATRQGALPPGAHPTTVAELARRFGSTRERRRLLEQLRRTLPQLRRMGIREVVVAGSFLTQKPAPRDLDLLYRIDRARPPQVGPDDLYEFASRLDRIQLRRAEDFVADAGTVARNGLRRRAFRARDPTAEEFMSYDRAGRRVGVAVIRLDRRSPHADRPAAGVNAAPAGRARTRRQAFPGSA
jgi:hypothetical protein